MVQNGGLSKNRLCVLEKRKQQYPPQKLAIKVQSELFFNFEGEGFPKGYSRKFQKWFHPNTSKDGMGDAEIEFELQSLSSV